MRDYEVRKLIRDLKRDRPQYMAEAKQRANKGGGFMRVVLVMGIMIIVFGMLSCGDGVTKATNLSQVVNAHFKYEDIRYEHIKGTDGRMATDVNGRLAIEYAITGRITNNSGVNIERAEFRAFCISGGEWVANDSHIMLGRYIGTVPVRSVFIHNFTKGSTRTFEEAVLFIAPDRSNSVPLCEDIVIEYEPQYK